MTKAEIIAGYPSHSWSIEQYHAMIAAGILASNDKVELLLGKMITRPPVSPLHAATNRKINSFFHRDSGENIISIKNPVTLAEDSEPEPDVMVLAGPLEQYDNHHPYAKDVLLLMEIADVSLEKDRTLKRYIYAISGIKEYWIIDVTGRKIEQYLSPQKDGSFGSLATFHENQTIQSNLLGDFKVADLLP